MLNQKTKSIISWILAIFIGYFCVRIFFHILGAAFFAAITLMKFIIILILIAFIAIPLYVVIRRKFIK